MAIFSLVPTPSVGGDEKRIDKPGGVEVKQRAEAADLIDNAGPPGRPGERLDGLDQPFSGIDIDARILVAETGDGLPLNDMLNVPRAGRRSAEKNARTRFSNQPSSPIRSA